METKMNKSLLMRYYSEKKSKIEFSGFERSLMLDPLKLTEENEIISLFNKIQEKINTLDEEAHDIDIFNDKARKEFYLAKARLNELDNDEIFNAFSIDLEADGATVVNVMRYETCLRVYNNIGCLNTLRDLVKNDLKDNKLFSTIANKSSQGTKPIYRSKKPEKPNENEYIRKYVCLIEFCFYALQKTCDLSKYRDNEFFEIYDVYPIRIRFRNSTGIYPITNILSNYFHMISKSVCKEIYDKSDKIENVIISFPSTFDIMQQMEIKQSIQSAGLVVKNMISKHELDSLLFQVQFELDKLKKQNEPSPLNTDVFNSREFRQLDYDKHYIEIEVREDGYCQVRMLKEYETKPIYNHIGDLDNLKLLLNTINSVKYEKLIELVKNYMGLIESSFSYLLKHETERMKNVDFGLFEILVDGLQYDIRLKKTSEVFSVDDLIVKYFELIVKAAWQVCGFQTQEIYLKTSPQFRITHQYVLKKYIEKATNNYVRLSGSCKLHELFFKVQEHLEQKPNKSVENTKSSTNMPIIKNMLEQNEITSDCLVVTLKDNCSVVVEMIENQTLSVLRHHIGDFESLGLLNQQHKSKLPQIKQTKATANKLVARVDERTKLISDYHDFIRFSFQAFYDKSRNQVKSDIFEVISTDPLKIRMKNSVEEYKINEIIIKFFQFVVGRAKKLVKHAKIENIVLITPGFYGIAKQFKLKDIVEKTRLDVIDVFSENQLSNLYMKLHNKISVIMKTNKTELDEYNGVIKVDDIEKTHTFGVDFTERGKINLVVLKDDQCLAIPNHIANIKIEQLAEKDRLGIDDFTKLLEIAIESFNLSKDAKLVSTQIFSSSGRYPTKVRLANSTKEYSTEDILKSYFECLARSVWETTGVVARNVILAVPSNYSIETILMIDSCIKRSNLKCRKLICENDLLNVFFQINSLFYDSQVEVPLDKLVAPVSKNADDLYNIWFAIDHNGAVAVQSLDGNKVKDLRNHFGDFSAITREFLRNTRLLARFKLGQENNIISKVHSENVEIAESFEKLIDYCFDSLNKEIETSPFKKFKLFQITNSNPIQIAFKSSSIDYKPVDVINCYFKAICLSIYRQTGIKPRNVTCSTIRLMTIDDEAKLKECLEKADLLLLKLLSNNKLNDIFFNVNCQYEIFLKNDDNSKMEDMPSSRDSNQKGDQGLKLPKIETATPRFDPKTNVPIIINSRGGAKDALSIKTSTPKTAERSRGKGASFAQKTDNDLIIVILQDNGDITVKSSKRDRVIEEHLGNFSSLNLLSNFKEFDSNIYNLVKMNTAKNRLELIKDFKALVKFCLVSLKGFGPDAYPRDNSLFRVSVQDQRIYFNSSIDASVSEVLTVYLQCLMKSLKPVIDVESCKFEFRIDYQFSLFEMFELKKCVDRAKIPLAAIKTNNALNDLFFQINFKLDTLEQEFEYYNRKDVTRFEIDLKKRLLENANTFAAFLSDDFDVLITKDGKLITVVNHVGNHDKVKAITKTIDEVKSMPNFSKCFKQLIEASLESFEGAVKIENELFRTTNDGFFELALDNYQTKYSFLTTFYNYIECISRTLEIWLGGEANKVILTTAFKANIASEFKIRELMMQSRFFLIDMICENSLINLFRNVSNQMQYFTEFENKQGRKTVISTKIRNSTIKKIGMNNTLLDASQRVLTPISHIEHVNKELLSFHIKANGEVGINLALEKSIMIVTNHIGDYDALISYAGLKEQYIVEKRKQLTADAEPTETSPDSFEKLYSEIRLIKHYRKLIDVCFQFIKGVEVECPSEVDDIFEVIHKKKRIVIRFKQSTTEYEVSDVLGIYFESISEFVNRRIGMSLTDIKCVVATEFDIYAQYEIRCCMEKANLTMLQLSTQDELQNLFLDVESVFLKSIDRKALKYNRSQVSLTMTEEEKQKQNAKRRETFCIQLNVDGAATVSAVDDNCESRIIDHHVGDFSVMTSSQNKDDIKTSEFIENYRNLIKFCINSLGKAPASCFTQRINIFKVVKTERVIKFISKLTLAEYTIEDILMAYFKFMMTSVWRITREKINQVILSLPLDYEEKIALKMCIEKANMKVMKIITKPIAKCFDIYLADSSQEKYGNYIFVDEDAVVLYRVEDNRPLIINSSLMDSKESYKEFMKTFNFNLKKQIPKYVSKLVNSKEFSRGILFKCYEQFNQGKEEAVLQFDDDEKFKIKKTELHEIAQKYISDTCQLMSDMLEQYGHSENYVSCVYYVFANFMAEELKKVVSNRPILRYVDSNSALLNIAALSHKLTNPESNIGIVKTLNFNIGFCNHLGIFEILLKQGLTLPCETSKVFTTVVNYQAAIELELYRGYRPLERYCEFLGIVAVKDISIAKANKIKIDVKFHINENEELIVEAFEKPTNRKLTLETENFKMKSKYEHNFHDSVVNKESDEKLVEKLKLTSSLVNRIRARYDGHSEQDELVSKKMDEYTNRLIESNKIIDIDECERIVEEVNQWLVDNNLQIS